MPDQKCSPTSISGEASTIPAHAKVAIIGGGIIGTSVAYHLTKIGIQDVVLFERKTLTCGTTWHAAGLVGQLRSTYNMTALAKYSASLYRRIEEETGQQTGFRCRGAINLADSDGLMTEYRRAASMAKRCDLEAQIWSPAQIVERCPLLNTEGLHGGVFLPSEGQIDPVGITQALAKGARQQGALIIEQTPIKRIVVEKGQIVGLKTANGEISADYVVLAAGMWSRQLAADIGITVPLQACEHYYIVTEPIADLPNDMPSIRDAGASAYYKEDAGKLLLGCFEKVARPWGENGIPDDFSFDSLPGNFDQFEPILKKAMQRLPLLETAGIQLFFCGPESFTPDNRYLLGETPEIRNLYVAAGMNSIGIQSAGGVGKVLAEWIRDGQAPVDLAEIDIARTMPFQRNRRYLRDRARESLGALFDVHWPYRQMETARGVRHSPLHQTLAAAGACFGEVAGWERPNWFMPMAPTPPRYSYDYGRQNWFDYNAQECRASQTSAAIFDLSSFAKYLVRGRDACHFLNHVCANQIEVSVGRIVYTSWLNERGGIEADVTVTRLAEDEFLILSGVASQTRDLAWLHRHRQENALVDIIDMTSAYALIGLFGPKTATILRAAGADSIGEESTPYGHLHSIEVGYALVQALRLGYAGEAGFELLMPTEFALNVYRALWEAGQAHGLVNGGMHAINSMRMEKGRRHFGDDITCENTPLEAGLSFAINWEKTGGFVGRDALLTQRPRPRSKRLLSFTLSAGTDAPLLFGEEPIFREGSLVGSVTSAAYGHRVGASLALGYAYRGADGVVDRAWCESGQWEIEIGGERHPATTSLAPLYDANNQALRLTS